MTIQEEQDLNNFNSWFASQRTHYTPDADADLAEAAWFAAIQSTKPSWDDAPSWATALAMDRDGTWVWYEEKPTPELKGDYWNTEGNCQNIDPKVSWMDTLEEKPRG